MQTKIPRIVAMGAIGVLIGLACPSPADADRIQIWKPLDIEKKRKFYKRLKREFPEETLRRYDRKKRALLTELTKELAPVKPRIDKYGTHYFEGRILKVIPPVNPSAPRSTPDFWPKIVFEAYGKGGTPKSRKVAVVSTKWAYVSHKRIDSTSDIVRLFSNRHSLMGENFGSPRHRQAIFAALDPDGSMGLSTGGGAKTPSGLREGALMVFGKAGMLSVSRANAIRLSRKSEMDPAGLSRFLREFGPFKQTGLPAEMLGELARWNLHPGAEPEFSEMMKAGLQMLYTLGVATPDLTTPRYRKQASRLAGLGSWTSYEIAKALEYRRAKRRNRQFKKSRPHMPLTVAGIRRVALEVLADGPVMPPPAPGLGNAESARLPGSPGDGLTDRLLEIIEKDKSLAPTSKRILERHLAPEPGEPPAVTALYETDRETYRETMRLFIFSVYGAYRKKHDPLRRHALGALARVGWGPKKEAEKFVDDLMYGASRGRKVTKGRRRAIEVLRKMTQPEKFARKDRLPQAQAAANRVNKSIAQLREDREKGKTGDGVRIFFELWDGGN